MAFTLYGYDNNPRTRLVAIVAAAHNIDLEKVEVVPRNNVNKDLLVREFPRSSGKIPALKGPGIKLTEVMAISVYLARISKSEGLMGDGSPEQEADVLSWMSWANQELLTTLAKWFLPLIPNFSVPAPYDKEAVEAGKAASLAMVEILEDQLKGRKHLVGNQMTLADAFVAIMLSRGLEWVLDGAWRRRHPNCMRHFTMVAQWEPVKNVVPEFKLIETETPNLNPYA